MPLWNKIKLVDPGKATMESTTRKAFTLFLAFAFIDHFNGFIREPNTFPEFLAHGITYLSPQIIEEN
jgi:hypothetical protein